MINIDFLNKHLDQFINTTKHIDYLDNGIFDSELFVIYSLFKKLNCDLLIESGICYGYSTKILLHSLNVDHCGIELSSQFVEFGRKLEKEHSNFKFYNEDSSLIIPKIIKENEDKNIFVNIDGPKGENAIKLKNNIKNYKNVKAISIHDHIDMNSDQIFSTRNNPEFNSIYFDKLNQKQKNKKHSDQINNTYYDVYPNGPGLVIYIENV